MSLGLWPGALFAVAVLLTAGCAGPRSYKVQRDIAFAQPAAQPLRLDLYRPRQTGPVPVVLWLHGGGWKYGGKGYRVLVRYLTDHGIAVASVQYRLSGQAKWPAQYEDCLAALEWLEKNGQAYGLDSERIALAGDSAGGHLALMVGLKENAPRVKSVLALYPPTDLCKLADYHGHRPGNLIEQLLGRPVAEIPNVAEAASPVSWVGTNDPVVFLIHGDKDHTVPLEQSEELREVIGKKGNPPHLIIARGRGHAFSLDASMRRAVAEFFRKTL